MVSHGLIPLLTLARIAQAWVATIYDWDTAELLIDADLEDRPPSNFANIAHPYALVIFSVILRGLKGVGLSPRTVWFFIIVAVFILTVATLYWVSRHMSQSRTWALVLTSFYLISPSTHEILARQEENLLYHLPLILTIYFLSRFEANPRNAHYWHRGLLAFFIVAICHFQPSASMMIGIGLWLALYLLRTNTKKDPAILKSFVIAGAIPAF